MLLKALAGDEFFQCWYAVNFQRTYAGLVMLWLIHGLTGQYWSENIDSAYRKELRFHVARSGFKRIRISAGWATDGNRRCRMVSLNISRWLFLGGMQMEKVKRNV